jgi:ribonuclease R
MEAMVVSLAESGMWVELAELFVEGFVPVEAILGESFGYRENLRAMVGRRTGRKYSLGDHIRVRVDRIEWGRLRPELSCLGPWQSEQ